MQNELDEIVERYYVVLHSTRKRQYERAQKVTVETD